MQRVVPLSGGAALLLSNSAFLTPKHQIIDHVCPAAFVGMRQDCGLPAPVVVMVLAHTDGRLLLP